MKKVLSFILAAAMAFSMTACSSGTSSTSSEGTEATNGTLKVATSPDFAPMEFVDLTKSGQDQYVGFDITLAKHIASELGMALEIQPMSFDACQVAVSTGTVDMAISGFSWTAEREENYNLSDYYQAGENESKQILITLKENEGKYTTKEALAGAKIGAQTASLQEALCKEQLPDNELVVIGDLTTALLQLQTGDFECLAVADGNADAIIASNPDIVKTGFEFEVDEKYTNNLILLQKGNDELTQKVNDILAKAKAEGLYDEWYNEALSIAGVEVAFDDEGNMIENTEETSSEETASEETSSEETAE